MLPGHKSFDGQSICVTQWDLTIVQCARSNQVHNDHTHTTIHNLQLLAATANLEYIGNAPTKLQNNVLPLMSLGSLVSEPDKLQHAAKGPLGQV
jgi:hypothetical protein